MALPFTGSSRSSSAGMSVSVPVTSDEAIRNTDMIRAAETSSFRVLAIRAAALVGSSFVPSMR